jgi:hypothetical protein
MAKTILLVFLACPILVYIETLIGFHIAWDMRGPETQQAMEHGFRLYSLAAHWLLLIPYAIYATKKWAKKRCQ